MSHPYRGLNELREMFLSFLRARAICACPASRWCPKTTSLSCSLTPV